MATATNLATQQICLRWLQQQICLPNRSALMAATTNLYIYTQQTSPWWLQQQIYLLNKSAPDGCNNKSIYSTDLPLVAATTNLPLVAATTNLPLVAATTNISTQQICPWWLQQIYLPNRFALGGYNNKSDPIYPTYWPLVATTKHLTPSTQQTGPWWL